MKAKAIAWGIAVLIGYGVFHVVSTWENPWGRGLGSKVVQQMPKLPPGCGKDCTE